MWFTRKLKKNFYFILAFLVPILIYGIALAIFGVYPFGIKSILILDLSSQYVEFFAAFRDIVLGNHSLFYTWGKTLGGNFIGIYSYYLSSPLSFITLLFPLKNLPEAIFLLTLIKIGLSGLTFSMLLYYLFKRKDVYLVVFSSFYALMSYAVLYAQNIMWLDGLIWLPIILIGAEKMIKKEKPWLYSVSLAMMFISSYYISYSLGLFVLIYMIYRLLLVTNYGEIKSAIKTVIVFGFSSVLSIGLAAWLLLPTYYALKQGKISSDFALPKLEVKYNIYQLISRLFVGSYDNINNLGTPNIYCGILVIILVLLFFINKDVDRKDKFLSFGVIVIFALSLSINLVDLFWHGLQTPNWFPSRYSFVFCFFLVITAYKSWLHIKSIAMPYILGTGVFVFTFAFITQQLHYKYMTLESIIPTYVLLGVYLVCFYFILQGKKTSKIFTVVLLVFVLAELYFNTAEMIWGLNGQVGYRDRSVYRKFREDLNPIVEEVQGDNQPFYRMEMNFYRGRNEAIAFGYRGITHYSSIYQQTVNNYMGKLGLAQENTRLIYNGATLWTDSLFSVKYILSKVPLMGAYEKQFEKGEISVFKNPYALSLGFMIDSSAIADTYKNINPFINQNHLIKKMTGTNKDAFIDIPEVTFETENLNFNKSTGKVKFTKIKSEEEGSILYSFIATEDGPYYGFFTSDKDEFAQLYVNDTYVSKAFDAEKQCVVFLGDYKKGDKVLTKFVLSTKTKTVNKPYVARLEMPVFEEAMVVLKSSELIITKATDAHIEGSIEVGAELGLFFTTLPYDEGWQVRVDGEQIQPEKFDDTFICFPLSQGAHTITFDYTSLGFKAGLMVSIISLSLLLLLVFVHLLSYNKNKLKRGEVDDLNNDTESIRS
ncbi:MAG: YfhO family protein [Vallitaleaceae bacterium]|nr:YfhO family protein [Vallitaleaceae bacterium]